MYGTPLFVCVLTCAELLNVFETFLPQLLMYPNPADPLNGEAAALLMNTPEEYRARVKGTPTFVMVLKLRLRSSVRHGGGN